MSKVINKKGISLVVLIITIIVLIVLTGAVIMTAVNVPSNAQLAVFKSNVATVQDAVTIKMLNNMVEYMDLNSNNVKWIGVANGYEEENIASAPTFGTNINGVAVVKLDDSMKEGLSISAEEFNKYYVDVNGIVYHTGYTHKGETYYNGNTSSVELTSIAITSPLTKTTYTVNEIIKPEGLVVTATYSNNTTADVASSVTYTPTLLEATETVGTKEITVSYGGKTATEKITITVQNWYDVVSSNGNVTEAKREEITEGGVTRTYYAPIPLGFTVVEGTNISTGLVIQDASANQFVWVPVNDSYNITNALGTTITGKTALAYWQDNANGTGTEGSGYNEPYPRTAGSWTKNEWDSMYASVLKYGGFYVGRYETGKKTVEGVTKPVVKAGQSVWNNVAWGSSMTEYGSNTATAISRGMYIGNDYGVVSTLIYGIQWDSVMNWANCASKTRGTDTYTSKPSPTGAVYADETTYDVNKNIYDLAGNVFELSMEAGGTTSRVHRGGDYSHAYAVSGRVSYYRPAYDRSGLGFRTALYIK